MNIEMNVSFFIMFFSGYMPRSGTARLYGNSIYSLFFNLFFNCKKNCFTMLCWFLPYTMQISHNYAFITYLLSLPLIPTSHHSRSSQSTKWDFLCYIATSEQLSILHLVEYTYWCYFICMYYSFLPPLCPQVHSLYLCPHCFPATRFINAIFLDFILLLLFSCCVWLFATIMTAAHQALLPLTISPDVFKFIPWVGDNI